MRTNRSVRRSTIHNHEGVRAQHISPMQALRRSLMGCMLWEGTFYEDGVEIAERISDLVMQLCKSGKAKEVQALAIEARTRFHLRHAPLFVCVGLARGGYLRASTLVGVIERPDEITEFLSLYWSQGKVPLSKQVKLGLAWAFRKFSAYQLAKYNRDGQVKLRDALFLCHAKPVDEAMAEVWKKLVDGTLETPDTWETNLSAGADKKATFERLMDENKLGGLAFLRNLRNMQEAGVPKTRVAEYAKTVNLDRVLPFRFIAAARAVPTWERVIEPMMVRAMADQPKLMGKTVMLVDTSPSMDAALSDKSDLTRKDAALGVAILLEGICDDLEVFAFSTECGAVASRSGFALADAIRNAVPSNGTLLGKAIKTVSGRYERLIVLTDEESQDGIVAPDPESKAYLVNLAVYKNGIGYGPFVHFDGFSEAVVDYIREYEAPVQP